MIHKGYEYVQGTAARQLEYDVYKENEVLKAKKRYKSNRKIKLKLVATIICVLLAGLAVMWRYAIITQMSYEISQKEKDYKELRNENALLKVQIETETDLTEIKELAENSLGMQTPDKSQIVYMKVPRNDYTVIMKTQGEEEGGGNFFNVSVKKVAGLIKLFE